MQTVHFETTVKDGYIKLPERYSLLNDKAVIVDLYRKENASLPKAERIRKVKEFLNECSGILKNTQVPPDITIEEIREMRLKEKYGQ